MWGTQDLEADPAKKQAHICPVLRFVGVRRPVVPQKFLFLFSAEVLADFLSFRIFLDPSLRY